MFGTLKGWRGGDGGTVEPSRIGVVTGGEPTPGASGEELRGHERYPFPGGVIYLFLSDEQRFVMRLRDVSCSGLAGLTDAPISVGELVVVQFEETLMPAAHVVWTRNTTVGLKLVNPLPASRMNRLVERHDAGAAWSPAMRESSDLNAWWTNTDEIDSGRKPKAKKGAKKDAA
ncbi:PilZ domain-containing protein [Sphingosinicella sp. YJ22]|uniref:PilZ domain-containing protein n=1 Tax=Sphingosinicella sp. YJ22 TaxID=1104780 RepID=UPI00140D41F2|nr:PilZ domain-containing protein [Sphingosinicella sp. YJ22]